MSSRNTTIFLSIVFGLLNSLGAICGVEGIISSETSTREGLIFHSVSSRFERKFSLFGWFAVREAGDWWVPTVSMSMPLEPSGSKGPSLFFLEGETRVTSDWKGVVRLRYSASEGEVGEASLQWPAKAKEWRFLVVAVDFESGKGRLEVGGRIDSARAGAGFQVGVSGFLRKGGVVVIGCEGEEKEVVARCPDLMVGDFNLISEYFDDPWLLFLLSAGEEGVGVSLDLPSTDTGNGRKEATATISGGSEVPSLVVMNGDGVSLGPLYLPIFSGRVSATTFYVVFDFDDSLPNGSRLFTFYIGESPYLWVDLTQGTQGRSAALTIAAVGGDPRGDSPRFEPKNADFLRPGKPFRLAVALLRTGEVLTPAVQDSATGDTFVGQSVAPPSAAQGSGTLRPGAAAGLRVRRLVVVPNAVGLAFNAMEASSRRRGCGTCGFWASFEGRPGSCIDCREGLAVDPEGLGCVDKCPMGFADIERRCMKTGNSTGMGRESGQPTLSQGIPYSNLSDGGDLPLPQSNPIFAEEEETTRRLGWAAFGIWLGGLAFGVMGFFVDCSSFESDSFLYQKFIQSFLIFQYFSFWLLFNARLPGNLLSFLRSTFELSTLWHRVFLGQTLRDFPRPGFEAGLTSRGFFRWIEEEIATQFLVSFALVLVVQAATVALAALAGLALAVSKRKPAFRVDPYIDVALARPYTVLPAHALIDPSRSPPYAPYSNLPNGPHAGSSDWRGWIARNFLLKIPITAWLIFTVEGVAFAVYNLVTASFDHGFFTASFVISIFWLSIYALFLCLVAWAGSRAWYSTFESKKSSFGFVWRGLDPYRQGAPIFQSIQYLHYALFSLTLVLAFPSRSAQAALTFIELTIFTFYIFLVRPAWLRFDRVEQMLLHLVLWVSKLLLCILVWDSKAGNLGPLERVRMGRAVVVMLFVVVVWNSLVLVGKFVGLVVELCLFWRMNGGGFQNFGQFPQGVVQTETIVNAEGVGQTMPVGQMVAMGNVGMVPSGPMMAVGPMMPLGAMVPSDQMMPVGQGQVLSSGPGMAFTGISSPSLPPAHQTYTSSPYLSRPNPPAYSYTSSSPFPPYNPSTGEVISRAERSLASGVSALEADRLSYFSRFDPRAPTPGSRSLIEEYEPNPPDVVSEIPLDRDSLMTNEIFQDRARLPGVWENEIPQSFEDRLESLARIKRLAQKKNR